MDEYNFTGNQGSSMSQPVAEYSVPEPVAAPRAAPVRRYSLALSERRMLLAGMDVVVLALLAKLVVQQEPGNGSWRLLAISVAGAWFIAGQSTSMYDLHTVARLRPCLRAIAQTATMVVVFLMLLFFTKPYFMSRPQLVDLAIGGPAVITLWRLAYLRFLGSAHFMRRVLVLGAGSSGRSLLEAVHRSQGHGVSVVGILDDDPSLHGMRIDDVPVLGGSARIWQIVSSLGVEEVVLAVSQPTNEALFEGLATCYERGIVVTLMPHLYEEVARQVPVEYMGRHWLGAVPLSRAGGGIYEALKRLVDVVVASLGVLLTSPILAIVALVVRLSSPGPILFRQTRVGHHGEEFEIIKFRTMWIDAERPGEVRWATRDDPRATTAGKWLRRTHLDELPQLVLVLTGRMSLVGPRPERPEFVRDLEQQIALYAARYSVRPGMTGWAQIQCPYGSSTTDALAKLRYDLYYVKHRSLLLDVCIIARTLTRVFGMRGR